MKKQVFSLLLSALLLFSCSTQVSSLEEESNFSSTTDVSLSESTPVYEEKEYTGEVTMKVHLVLHDSYPTTDKVIVNFHANINPSDIDASTFTYNTAGKTYYPTLDCFASDENGNPVSYRTPFVTCLLDASKTRPIFTTSSGTTVWVSRYPMKLKLKDDFSLTIGSTVVKDETFSYDAISDWYTEALDDIQLGSYTDETTTLTTALYTPEVLKKDNGKNPLLIWLHGGGEGGSDIRIPLFYDYTLNLTTDLVQSYFTDENHDGCYVGYFQCPTFWMDGGEGTYNDQDNTPNKQTSMYTEVLHQAIQKMIEDNPDIDPERVFITGCSNGGYMTMNMAIEHGDDYAAYIPICEAYKNIKISEDDLSSLKERNLWFIQSDDDGTVDPKEHSLPTYYRMVEEGSTKVRYSYLHGYNHLVWRAFLNDDVNVIFDNEEVKEDYPNIVIDENGCLASDSYATHENCTQEVDSPFYWLAQF